MIMYVLMIPLRMEMLAIHAVMYGRVPPVLLRYTLAGFLSREKTFVNYLKIDFRGENISKFAVTQCTTPTSIVSNRLKIDFHRENISKFAVTQCTTPTSIVSNRLKIDFRRETLANLL